MTHAEKERLIKSDILSIENRVRHAFNQGYDIGYKDGSEKQLKTGHWIDTDEWRETVYGFEQWGYFRKCSECGYVFKFLEIDNYCPNCGRHMVEPQESEDKEQEE